ncbi:hypothetical protein Q9L58_009064, partial [Maublancomyces gigas]
DLPVVNADDLAAGSNEGAFTFPLKITDVYGISPTSLPNGRSPDERYDVDAGSLVDFVRTFRPLLGRQLERGNRH